MPPLPPPPALRWNFQNKLRGAAADLADEGLVVVGSGLGVRHTHEERVIADHAVVGEGWISFLATMQGKELTTKERNNTQKKHSTGFGSFKMRSTDA